MESDASTSVTKKNVYIPYVPGLGTQEENIFYF
jgi:hypothetical protein